MLSAIIISIIFSVSLFTLGYIGITKQYTTWAIIFEKWIPAAISPVSAGIFLVLLIPWVNHFYWRKRTQNERRWADEKFKHEILSDATELLDGALLHISRLSELNDELKLSSEDMEANLKQEILVIHRDKLEIEKGIARVSKLIELFFDKSISSEMREWITKYNTARKTFRVWDPNHALPRRAAKILTAMRDEITIKTIN